MAECNRRERNLLRQIEAALGESSLPPPNRGRIVGGLARAIGRFRAENRNRAGVTREAGKRTEQLLERVLHAVSHAKEHQDGEVRRQATRLVRSAQSETFEQLEDRASKLRGTMNKSTHRLNELRQRELAWRCRLDEGTELAEVPTVDSLRSVGRELGLCVANRDETARDYHVRLREGESKFYTLSKEGELLWLAELDMNTDTIVEISAHSNDCVKLAHKQALRILEALEATADKEDTFANVGAFSTYLFGKEPDTRMHLIVNECSYRVDVFADQGRVVVRDVSGRRRTRWSLFQYEAPAGRGLGEWYSIYCGGIDLGQFVVLLLQRKVAGKISRLFG